MMLHHFINFRNHFDKRILTNIVQEEASLKLSSSTIAFNSTSALDHDDPVFQTVATPQNSERSDLLGNLNIYGH